MKWSRAASGSGRPYTDAAPGWTEGSGFRGSHHHHNPGGRRHLPASNSRRQDWLCPAVDSQDTYICCAYSPRCFIIQKVKPTGPNVEENSPKEVSVTLETTANEDGHSPGDVSCAAASASPVNGDSISKAQVVFPAMEDTPEISTSLSPEATSTSATIPVSNEPIVFPARNNASDIYPSSLGQTEESNGNSGEKNIPLHELKSLLRQQLEYYFSRENLATDAYLLSQMDSDQYVPIGTIAKFNQIRRLTEDINLIVEVLRESALVQVDEDGEKVRPSPRSYVLILREIPESTPIKELEDLFDSENCPKFSRCEFAHNNSWYVLFESDEDAHRAYRYLSEEAKTFNGKPIRARIKARLMTSVQFPNAFKNGTSQSTETEVPYNNTQVNQQQPNNVQYTYANVPNDSFNNHVCPPFYPPTMLQAWAPSTPACVDLGTVFSMNGLSPQAAFRPLNNNTNRQNFTSRDKQLKGYNQQQNYNYGRTEQNRYYNRSQSTTYLQRQQQQHSLHNLMNTGTCGFDYMTYPSGSRNVHSFGVDFGFLGAPNLFFRRAPGHSSVYPSHTSQSRHNPMLLGRNQVGLGAINGQDQNYLAVGSGVLPFAKDSVLGVAAGVGKQSSDSQVKESWVPTQRQRNKRWWKDNGGSSASSKSSLGGGDVKPESPKFDLETSSFPPLPGCLDTDVLDVDVYASRLSDVVKGTVKPSTRDSKTQTSESSLSPCAVMKDSSTLTIEEVTFPPNVDVTFTPPTSPAGMEDTAPQSEHLSGDKIDDWNQKPFVEDPCNDICSNSTVSISSSTMGSVSTTTNSVATTTSATNSPSKSSVVVPNVMSTVISLSDALINVPNISELKHSPPKLPRNKQMDIVPKIKSEVSPKNKSPESVTMKNKSDNFKDKSTLSVKSKSSTFSTNKLLESSSSKEKSSDLVVISAKNELSVSKSSDAFSVKDKLAQVHVSKPKLYDSSTSMTKGPEIEPPTPLLSVNGHMDNESPPSSEDEKPGRKLTYSEVAIRAKERVEKLAQELKEKERQEALVRHHRQQEIVAQGKQASTRGVFRDFSKPKVVDQQRPGCREWRERRKAARAVPLPSAGQ